ncbi:MAG: malectin domain-containing carbohydrate-binding protein [Phycisphaerales bacterium]
MRRFGTGGLVAFAGAAAVMTSTAASGQVFFGETSGFNEVSDLDLTGVFAYAVNVTPNDLETFSIGSVDFTPSGVTSGVQVLSNFSRDNWRSRPFYDHQGLEDIMWDIRFATQGDVAINMDVEAGTVYKLQLLFNEGYWTEAEKRSFDILVEDALAVDEFDIVATSQRIEGENTRSAMFTYTFTAQDDVLNIMLRQGSLYEDKIPLLNAMTLEIIPTPAAFGLLSIAGLAGLAARRRREA